MVRPLLSPPSPATFENVERWLKELRDHADNNIVRDSESRRLLRDI